MLLLPRANVEARDPDSGWTPLHFASRQRELAAVEVLIKNQAFVGARAPDGRTPLHLAAGWGTYEVRIMDLHRRTSGRLFLFFLGRGEAIRSEGACAGVHFLAVNQTTPATQM